MKLDVSPRRLLVLGSAVNPPSREGLLQLIQRLLRLRGNFPHEIHVAGNETHVLRQHSMLDRSSSTAASSRTDYTSDGLFRGGHRFSDPGSGALTRIPELLLAGLPVICNPHAARSAQHYDGVEIFDTDEELVSLLNPRASIPSAPSRPVQAEERLIKRLRELGGLSNANNGEMSFRACS